MRAAREDEGQGTVELALILPVVALLVLVVLQIGLVMRDRVLLTHATREAVRAASVATDDRVAAAHRAADRSGELDPGRLDEQVTVSDDGTEVRVEVTYRSPTDLPLVGALVPDVEFRESATMRVESVEDGG